LANSTPIAERIGPEAMHTLLNRFFEVALNEVHRYEGTINQFLGDGFMALFGAPLAHEDHARRAVFAALALQRTLKEAHLGEPYGVECAFRMGLNSGLVVVGSIGDNLRMDYSAVGDTTNLASRLQDHAAPGDILISESTSRLVQGAVRLEGLPPVQVKGKIEPVSIYKVVGTLPRRSPIASRSERILSPFVGRERELATLEAVFAQVEASQGQVVGIVAEAGGGKSRLLYEFRQRLQDKQVTYLEGRCLSYGSTMPYHPLLDVLRHNCGISETESPEAIIEKVRFALQEVGMDVEATLPYLLQLLGVKEGTEPIAVLTPEAIRTRTFDTLKQMSLQGSQQRPLIFEIEDLHWIDKTSEDYLASLVESLPGTSILLLTTYRPGYQPSWLAKSYATQLALRSLASHDAITVVHSTSQQKAVPQHLKQVIIDKAQGNPFFLEELTRAVIEHGDTAASIDVPDTIQGVLSARIDRLPEESKRLLQTASILGREFSPTLLERIWDGKASPVPLLAELKRLEFLYEHAGAEEPFYVFKHALTQEVAYASLLQTRRHVLHAAAGQVLEELYAARLEEAYDRLAYHYARTDHAAKAVAYLTLVAEKAARRYAHTEAVVSLEEALEHAARLPADQCDYYCLDVVVRQGESLFYLGRRQELLDLLLGQQQRLERLHAPLLAARYYFQISRAYSFLGQREHTTQNLATALRYAEQSRDALTLGMVYVWLAQECNFACQFIQGIAHGRHAVSLLEQSGEPWWLGYAHVTLGYTYARHGDFALALDAAAQITAIGEAIGDRRLLTNTAFLTGFVYAAKGEWDASIAAYQQALARAPDPFETAVVLGSLGDAYREQGKVAEAIPLLEQAVQDAQQYRSRQVQSWFFTFLGRAYGAQGRTAEAREWICQGLALATTIANPWGIGLAQRALGWLALVSGACAEAEQALHDALHTLSSIHCRMEIGRTHLDLAALAFIQCNPDTATEHLSLAAAWFKKLQVPRWVEQTEQFAREYGVTLVEVALEEVTKGET
jgi:class 3 adenylate cyclase/tetratricopeptide (TPR) repeat protein